MAALATDNFNRADGALGANWTTNSSGGAFSIASNVCSVSNLLNDVQSYYNPVTWPNDQYAQAKATDNGGGTTEGVGVAVRCASGTGTKSCYRIIVNNNGSNNFEIAKLVAGTHTTLGSTQTVTYGAGNVIYGEAQGTTVIGKYNGAAVGTPITDSALASGNAGIAYSSTATSASLDDWEGGDFAAAAATPFPPFRRRVVRLPGAA